MYSSLKELLKQIHGLHSATYLSLVRLVLQRTLIIKACLLIIPTTIVIVNALELVYQISCH